MLSGLPLFLKRPIAVNSQTDSDDVVVLKRSLELLGYYERPEWGIQGFTDNNMFNGIRQFQKDHRLHVDGVMQPEGETAAAMGPILEQLNGPQGDNEEQALNPSSKPRRDQCEDLYYNRDIPICNEVSHIWGPRQGILCQQTAAIRYSMCIRGLPLHTLPPLDDMGWGSQK